MAVNRENNPKSSSNNPGISCPSLGLKSDPLVCYGYASEGNYCYRVSFPEVVRILYQGHFCLTERYEFCKVFKNPGIQHLPDDIKHVPRKEKGKSPGFSYFVPVMMVSALLILIILSLKTFQDTSPIIPVSGDQGSIGGTSSYLTAEALEKDQIQTTPTPVNGIALTEGAESTPAVTETQDTTGIGLTLPTPGPEKLTPYGPDGRYVLHKVRPGESLAFLASIYRTTVDVLLWLNLLPEDSSLQAGQVLIVMPNQVDLAGLLQFQVIQVQVETRVLDLAEQFGVSENDLRWLNSLAPGEWLPVGRRLIIPITPEGG
jgi:hypothetical protein